MHSSQTTFVVGSILLIMASCSINSGNAAFKFSMNQTCQFYSGFVADPSSCKSYGYCRDGILVGTRNCNEGLVFDRAGAICTTPDKATCIDATTANVCASYSKPTFVMNPQNCSEYCYCDQNQSQGCRGCPINQVFNAVTTKCEWSSAGICPLQSICALIPDLQFAADPVSENCGNYLVCSGGAEFQKSTPCNQQNSKIIYNPITNLCEENPTFCADSNVPSSHEDQCSNAGAGDFVSDGKTCSGFFYCTSDTEGIFGRCPPGLHFSGSDGSNTEQLCVNPLSVKCSKDRCDNVKLGFMTDTQIPGCANYKRCSNGVAETDNTGNFVSTPCKDSDGNFQYFDEVRQGCVQNEPKIPGSQDVYHICT